MRTWVVNTHKKNYRIHNRLKAAAIKENKRKILQPTTCTLQVQVLISIDYFPITWMIVLLYGPNCWFIFVSFCFKVHTGKNQTTRSILQVMKLLRLFSRQNSSFGKANNNITMETSCAFERSDTGRMMATEGIFP